jgi:hypothetical protein
VRCAVHPLAGATILNLVCGAQVGSAAAALSLLAGSPALAYNIMDDINAPASTPASKPSSSSSSSTATPFTNNSFSGVAVRASPPRASKRTLADHRETSVGKAAGWLHPRWHPRPFTAG